MSQQRNFGMTLRAARLGYREMVGVGFVRISTCAGGAHKIDLAPWDNVPITKAAGGEHVVWWEGDTKLIEETIRKHVPEEVTEQRSIYLDDEGNLA